MLFWNALLGILYLLAVVAALAGAFGFISLIWLSDHALWVRIAAWIASLLALAGLIAIAVANQWGPFDPHACTRSRPCLQLQAPQQTLMMSVARHPLESP